MARKRNIAFLMLRYVLLFAVMGGAIYLVNTFVGRNSAKSYASPAPLVATAKPEKRNISRKVTVSSHVEADAMIPVVPLVSGTVMEYDAEVESLVKEGDVIAVLDDEPFRQQMLQAQAAYLAADNTFQRVTALYDKKNTTVQNYDEAKAQRDVAKAQYDLATLQMDYAVVKAKASGTILTAPSAKGSTAAQGTPLAVIADLDDLVVNLKVPEKAYDLFLTGHDSLSVTVTKPGSDVSVRAKVLSIDPFIQVQSKVFGVRCRLLGDVSGFRPGMYVKAVIAYDAHDDVFSLPQTVRKPDGSCYVYDEATRTVHHVEFVPEIEDDQYFMVPKEYAEALFVTDGQNSVFDGQTVRLEASE